MILLDSDHLTVYSYLDHPRAEALKNRLHAAGAWLLLEKLCSNFKSGKHVHFFKT